jgi:hypothetical protein
MNFNIQIAGLSNLLVKLVEAPSTAAPILQRALSASQAVLANHTTRDTVPWKTGFLMQSFRGELTTGMLRWFPTASYARFVEYGTAPHIIRPKNAQALYWDGAQHPVKLVHHPGTKANPFIERIIAASQDEIDQTFLTALQQIISQIAAI